jgi:ubiquinone/menaquinone biosynthesis C-methylase UbiE
MTTWWNKNVEARIGDFKSWIGDYNKDTKIYCRNYVANKKYKTIIDCGCGVATEYYGYKSDKYEINYTGLDSCKYLIDLNINQGINMIYAELEKPLPIEDNLYDCVYCREVIEHLPYYEKTINSFIRIAKKEIIIVWFLKPHLSPDKFNYWYQEDLYHNQYNIEELEKFILSNQKVDGLFWKDFKEKESVLHIILK